MESIVLGPAPSTARRSKAWGDAATLLAETDGALARARLLAALSRSQRAARSAVATMRGELRRHFDYLTSVILVGSVVVLVIMVFVFPQFAELFEGFGADLPPMTQLLVNLSNFVVEYWPILVLVAIPITWICGYREAASGLVAIGENRRTLERTYLPASCR